MHEQLSARNLIEICLSQLEGFIFVVDSDVMYQNIWVCWQSDDSDLILHDLADCCENKIFLEPTGTSMHRVDTRWYRF